MSADFGFTDSTVATPRDYFVPDFGVDHDIMYTENNIKMAEVATGHSMTADWGFTDSTVATPRNYFVPDFGLDDDILGVQDSLGWAQKDLSHTWTPEQDSNGYWNVPEAASNDSYSYNADSGFTDHLVAGGGM